MMELPTPVRWLWRRRLLLAIGAVVALALGFKVAGDSASGAVATKSVVLDTPTSQVIEGAPYGADTLPWRASLLVHLMASEPIKRQLAGELGIAPDQLAVVDPALSEPQVRTSLSEAALEAAASRAAPYVLTASLRDESLPIISIEAAASDSDRAARLAEAAASVLKAQTPPPEEVTDVSFAQAEAEATVVLPSRLQGFVVDDVAAVQVKAVFKGADLLTVVGLSLLAFGIWLACMALGPPLVRYATGTRSRRAVSSRRGSSSREPVPRD